MQTLHITVVKAHGRCGGLRYHIRRLNSIGYKISFTCKARRDSEGRCAALCAPNASERGVLPRQPFFALTSLTTRATARERLYVLLLDGTNAPC